MKVYTPILGKKNIRTKADAEFLLRHNALDADRIMGVETGGCPHTKIREDASINLSAVDTMCDRFPSLDVSSLKLQKNALYENATSK